jgi:hypothetical protein
MGEPRDEAEESERSMAREPQPEHQFADDAIALTV